MLKSCFNYSFYKFFPEFLIFVQIFLNFDIVSDKVPGSCQNKSRFDFCRLLFYCKYILQGEYITLDSTLI